MRGKEKFKLLSPVLNALTLFFRITPQFFNDFCWDIFSIFSSSLFVGLRYAILKADAKSVGSNVYIGKYVCIKEKKNILIGDNVSIHDYSYIDATGGVVIGNDVSIAHSCTILTKNHSWSDLGQPIKYNPEFVFKTTIEDDVWIGCGVRILAGVKVCRRSVVAAGAVMNKDNEPESVYGGVPAKLIKQFKTQ